MDTATEARQVHQALEAFYAQANQPLRLPGGVTDQVADVFFAMLSEAARCSRALAWVPRPTGGKATVRWLARQLATSVFRQMQTRLSVTCVRATIYRWDRVLQLASLNLAMSELGKSA